MISTNTKRIQVPHKAIERIGHEKLLFRLAWVAFALFCAGMVYRMFHRGLNIDEVEAIHAAWKMNQGQRPYFDFFQHHHPVLYYLLQPLVAWWGEHASALLVGRLAMLPFIGGIFAVTYVLARRVFGRAVATLSMLLLVTNYLFIARVIEIRPDMAQTLFGMLAVLLFLPASGRPARWHYAVAGACLGVSFLFLQKAVFTAGVLGMVLLSRIARREAKGMDLLTWIAGGFLTVAPFALVLVLRGEFAEYYFLNWTMNLHFLDRFSVLKFGGRIYFWLAPQLVFAAAGVLAFLSTARQRELAFLLICLGLAPALVRSPYLQYWIPFFPLMAMFAALGLLRLLRVPAPAFAALVFFGFLVPSGLASATIEPANVLISLAPEDQLSHQLALTDYVTSVTGPDDCVYDGDARFNMFRHDLDYFWYSVGPINGLPTYQMLRPYHYDIYELIGAKKPKVISTYQIKNGRDPRLQGHYVRSKEFPEVLLRRD